MDGSSTAPLKARVAGQHRDVPVPAWLQAKIREHVAQHGHPVSGYVFAGAGRQPYVASSTFRKSFAQAVAGAGLPASFTFHQFRHAYATACLANGVQIHELSRWLGHASITVTVDTYGHLLPDAWDRGRAALDADFEQWSTAA